MRRRLASLVLAAALGAGLDGGTPVEIAPFPDGPGDGW